MSHKYFMMALLIAVFAAVGSKTVLSAPAPAAADECKIYNSTGDPKVFRTWTLDEKVVVIPWGQAAAVWIDKECGTGSGVWKYQSEPGNLTFEEEATANGRSILIKAITGTGIMAVKVTMTTPAKSFVMTVVLTPSYDIDSASLQAAIGSMGSNVSAIQHNVTNLHKQVGDANVNANKARSDANTALIVAHQAKARAEAGVELLLSPMLSNIPTGEVGIGGGLGVSLGGALWKSANQKIHLGLSGSIVWSSYEMRILGRTTVNTDVYAQEVDLVPRFAFKWQMHPIVALYAETGIGIRFFSHSDGVASQESSPEDRVRGVEGGVDFHGIWNAEVGFRFYPLKWLVLGVGFHVTGTLDKQISEVSGDRRAVDPTRENVWRYGLIISLGAAL